MYEITKSVDCYYTENVGKRLRKCWRFLEERYNKNKHNKRKNGKHLKTFSVYVICCKKYIYCLFFGCFLVVVFLTKTGLHFPIQKVLC